MIATKERCCIFPTTYDGDILRLEFEYREEAESLAWAIEMLQAMIAERYDSKKNKWRVPREQPIEGFKFKTTLQFLVAQEHAQEIIAIVGLAVFGIRGKDDNVKIVPLPPFSSKKK